MHGQQQLVLELSLLLLGSFAVPLLARLLRVPSAVLLIAYGFAVGPAVGSLVRDGAIIGFLHEFGFVLLMFLAGLEIDFNGVRRRGAGALMAMLSICIAVLSLAFAATWALGLHPIFGLALGATSVGLPIAILKESGRLRSEVGQIVLLVGSVGEFLTLIGMTVLDLSARFGLSLHLLLGLGKLIGIFAVAGLTLRLATALAWWRPDRLSRLVEVEDGSELGVRASLLVMIAFSALALLADVEAIVGAFLAGALIAFVLRGKKVLEEKLAVVGYGLLIPLFFIIVGMRFDLRSAQLSTLFAAGQLLIAALLIRLVPSLWFLRQGLSLRETLGTASLLSAPLTLMVAIAVLGHKVGMIDGADKSTLIVLAVATSVVFPVLYRLLLPAPPTAKGRAHEPKT